MNDALIKAVEGAISIKKVLIIAAAAGTVAVTAVTAVMCYNRRKAV